MLWCRVYMGIQGAHASLGLDYLSALLHGRAVAAAVTLSL